MDPRGKTVLITGASQGIGAAAARAFAAAGGRLVLAARDAAALAALAATLPGALAVPTDVTDAGAVAALVARAVAETGRLDIVISNAGVGLAAPVERLSPADLRQALEVNLVGPLLLTQAALPLLRGQGKGQLIFVSSVVGWRALPYLGGYAAAKAALDRLTESLRVELRGSGVAVTLFRPGSTKTAFSVNRLGQGRERRKVSGHAATPEQVAAALVRAARREPRVGYVTLRDRAQVLAGLLLPGLTDKILGDAFSWEE